ncbi:hypothetical protein [Nostoc sp. DedQUE09]|nr:hypothetical protein [Nostoc sp. DedQUE09]MDZ7951305.1 hypothetical protein [Nostoc sp. DedQUE09]
MKKESVEVSCSICHLVTQWDSYSALFWIMVERSLAKNFNRTIYT